MCSFAVQAGVGGWGRKFKISLIHPKTPRTSRGEGGGIQTTLERDVTVSSSWKPETVHEGSGNRQPHGRQHHTLHSDPLDSTQARPHTLPLNPRTVRPLYQGEGAPPAWCVWGLSSGIPQPAFLVTVCHGGTHGTAQGLVGLWVGNLTSAAFLHPNAKDLSDFCPAEQP